MDLDLIRSIVTSLSFVLFLAICFWAYSASAKKGFDEAAQLPFIDDDRPASRPSEGTLS